MSVSKPLYRSAAVKAVALGIAVAVFSLHAQQRRGGPTPPGTPGDFHVTATTSASVTFAWNASSPGSGGGLIYEIYNDTTGLIFNVGNVTSYTWTAVQSGGTYSFHIIAVAGNLASAPSPEVKVTIPGAPPLPQPVKPAPPVVTSTSVTSNSITVSWTESTPANEIGGYAVSVNGIGDTCSSSSASPTTATCTGLWPSFNYAVAITAYSLNGTTGAISTTGTPVTVTTAASTTPPNPNAPTAPTGLTGGGDGGGEALIYWNPSTSANTPQADIQYLIYVDGVLDLFDSSVTSQGTTGDTGSPSQPIYIFPRGATIPAQVWIVAVDQFGNQSPPSNVLTLSGF